MAKTPDVVDGGIIQSSWGNEIRNRTIQVFASAAERASQWPTPPRGAISYLNDVGNLWVHNGTAWGIFPVNDLVSSAGATFTGSVRLINGTINADAGLALNAGAGSRRADTNARLNLTVPAAGVNWYDKQLVVVGGNLAAGTLPGLAMEATGLGAIIFQAYTSSQSSIGFHIVNAANSAYCSLTASNLAVPSERRLKRDIQPLALEDQGGALAVVEQLQAVTFTLPPQAPIEYPPGLGPPEDETPTQLSPPEPLPSVGFIAEEVAAAGAPVGVVNPPSEGVPATLDLMGMIALLTEAVKELTARVTALEGAPA